MSKTKKITQNINKDAGLLDMPNVIVPTSKWGSKFANYCSMNAGDIYPVYVSEVVPKEKRKVTMAMLSHLSTPVAPLLNAMYTELRAFYVPHRLSADLLGGYSTRRSPWVKVFGEDPSRENSNIVVNIENQTLPNVSTAFATVCAGLSKNTFGGIFDALDYEDKGLSSSSDKIGWYRQINFLSMSAYELIYQYCYRNQNREGAASSDLYKLLFNAYNTSDSTARGTDNLHTANREKDYFTGAQPFTQKGNPVNVGLLGNAPIVGENTTHSLGAAGMKFFSSGQTDNKWYDLGYQTTDNKVRSVPGDDPDTALAVTHTNLVADLSSVAGVNIEQLRLMIKTQEMLEKDMMYGTDYASFLNAHFGVKIAKGLLDEPQEIRKLIVTTQMQAVLQSSTTDNEPTILGTIGANSTTQSGDLEIVPETFFPEYGYLIICAVHKTQNVYDALYYKPKHIFKKGRFDYFQVEIEDLGYQKVDGREFAYATNGVNAVGFNESFAEYRFVFNKCHGMVEPSRANALSYWTTAVSNISDIQTLYKQSKDEVDRAISIKSTNAPQFFDAYGFIEINDKPMKLHSIPGMDGVI